VKLRFVPEKFDVLTNAQMKTFDGNYFEHSPASDHTDHAIMGYEYEFKISTADHVWIMKKTIKSGFRWRSKELWAEMDLNRTATLERLTYSEVLTFFQALKDDGYTGISVDMPYYMDSPYDSRVYALKDRDGSISLWNMRTPTENELERVLKAIEDVGMEAHVRGNIYISQKYQKEHGFAWSSMITPHDQSSFFSYYADLWINLAPILNKHHVRLITPFTEMDGIEQYSDLVKSMYTRISQVFNGEMGFEEATNLMLEGNSPVQQSRTFQDMEENFTFWDWTDKEGRPMRIEYSCWTPPLDTQKDQRTSIMPKNFVVFWKVARNYYGQRYPEAMQMFGEIGVYGANGVCLGPDYWSIKNKVFDDQEMADIWYAYLKGIRGLGIDQLNVWTIALGDLWDNENPGNTLVAVGLRQLKSYPYRIITSIIKPNE